MKHLRTGFLTKHRILSISRAGLASAVLAAMVLVGSIDADAGSIFLTGHDPDFHASLGGNAVGARNINIAAINYVQDPTFNPYVAVAPKFLFVQSNIAPPAGHTVGKAGIVASGYVEGVDFDHHDATTLNAALNQLGVPGGYSAIVIASDYGGILTQAELNILNSRQADIANFLNSGGGLYAMAESNSGAHLTPSGGWYSFIPTIVASVNVDQNEVGNTVSPLGAAIGLTNADINGNASHAVFTGINGFTPVDYDSAGRILSIAGREQVIPVESTTWGKVKSLYR
jgi:hypothetical protein